MESKALRLLLGIWEVSVLSGKWACVMASIRLAMICIEATFCGDWHGFGATDGRCSLTVTFKKEKR